MISVKNKLFPRNFNKSNKSSFKSKPRKKKLLNVRDARLKILKNRAPYSVKNISDARLKIEQQRHSVTYILSILMYKHYYFIQFFLIIRLHCFCINF